MSEPVYDPLIDRVPLLLQFDGSMVDSSPVGHVMTASANAVLDTTRQRFGTGCLHINAESGRVLSAASAALAVGGAVPWTLEMSLRFPGAVVQCIPLWGFSDYVNANAAVVYLGVNSGRLMAHLQGITFSPFVGVIINAPLVADRWYQVMLRSMSNGAGGWVREIWLDGVLLGAYTSASPPPSMLSTGSGQGQWIVGFGPPVFTPGPGGPVLIDSVRLTNNYARSYAEQTDVFGTVAPPTFWPGAGQAWPGGSVAI